MATTPPPQLEKLCSEAPRLPTAEIIKGLSANPERGLTSAEVEKRLQLWGRNELPSKPPTPMWKLILAQFKETLVLILLGSACVSFVLAFFEEEHERVTAFVEPAVILLILILNATIGVVQESRAEAAIDALMTYMAPTATVVRDGAEAKIPAAELVPGDTVLVTVGDQVPADARVVQVSTTSLRCDQAILTGESYEVEKLLVADESEKDAAFFSTMVYSGTAVTYGKARAIVTGTGLRTAVGAIHKNIDEQEESKTPLQKKLDEFGETLSKMIMVICVLVWLININHFSEHGSILRGAVYYFKIAVALAVAAIPEGLPAVVTTCLALGTREMAKRKALVRSLPSVETLGCTTVICSDKTGTLTTNMMSVQAVTTFQLESALVNYEVADTGFNTWEAGKVRLAGGAVIAAPLAADPALAEVAAVCALCNDSKLKLEGKAEAATRIGEATEAALRVLVEKLGLPSEAPGATKLEQLPREERLMACNQHWEKQWARERQLEFTRARKSMSVLCRHGGGGLARLFVKGAPEGVIERSTHVLTAGGVVPLTGAGRAAILERLKVLTKGGRGGHTLRCLALATRTLSTPEIARQVDAASKSPDTFAEAEQGLTLVGIVGMLDPPREEVRRSIDLCRTAGIRVVVITGDHKDTAEAICRQINVFGPDEKTDGMSFEGTQVDRWTPEELAINVRRARLFARTAPEHKFKLVTALKKAGEVVAMTGDGVNDAPALKSADIGVAMGSGTEVAKGASKMVLADDNFATIVSAIEHGRAIFTNTKQFIRYLISSNIGEVVCIFAAAALGLPEVLVPVQLLWVNLVTDGLPATALGFNKPEPNIMRVPPRPPAERIVSGWMLFRYIVVGTYVGLATVGGFVWWYLWNPYGPQLTFQELRHHHKCTGSACELFDDRSAATVGLSVLVIVEMFNALNALSENESVFTMGVFSNPYLVLAIALSISLHLMILHVPFFATIFGLEPLYASEWAAVIAISFPVLVIDEILKFVARVLAAQELRARLTDKKRN